MRLRSTTRSRCTPTSAVPVHRGAAAVLAVFLLGCTDVGLLPGSLDNLHLQLLSGSISANLMPIVPPDPVSCQLTLLVKNESQVVQLRGIRIPEADVFVSSTGERLGRISFSTEWDGLLDEGEQDTVRLTKAELRTPLFTPPCGKYVRLQLLIESHASARTTFTVDSLMFSCLF